MWRRSYHLSPRQGSRKPWRLHQNYALDLASLKFGKVDDGVMQFRRRADALPEPKRELEAAE